MGVTIDSLQIEIQSSSANAAKGIDDLATSLGNLKKNGSFKTVSNNLNNLSQSLKGLSNVYQASNSLRNLANSIEKLKSVGSVASLANSLTKLPAALKSLEAVNTDGIKIKVLGLVDALGGLTQIKASGFSSMVNSMAKIEKVTQSLSTEKIQAFKEKIEELGAAIGPFATKMGTIKDAFKGLNTAIRQTNVSIDEAEINVTTLNFDNLMSSLQHIYSILQPIAQAFAKIVNESAEWDGIATRFGKGFGEQAQETYEWIQRLNEEMGINVQQFMKYSSTYATMLKGFGVAQEDSTKMALGYMELTYDIWAAHNDIYQTLDDAADAVRSAIAGEVEPVRHAGFTIIESTLQETAANHGLAISLETATEAQKSYLRYLTMVDQARATQLVGTYAKELNTAEGVMRTLNQQVKSLSQAFGSLFLPILVRVIPWVQALVELLADGVYWLANLFGVDIQPVDFSGYDSGADAIENVTNSAGDATGALNDATQAAKELKNATLGIDELNVISPSSATGSGTGSGSGADGAGGNDFGGLGIDSLWDEAIFDSIQSNVDELKGKIKGMFDEWKPTLMAIGGALGAWSIASLLGQLGDAIGLADDFQGKITTIKKLAASAIIIAVSFKLMGDAFEEYMGKDGTIFDYLEAVLIGAGSTYLLSKQWGKGGLAIGLAVMATVSLKTVIEAGGVTDAESATVAITGLATALGAIAVGAKALGDAWKVVKASKFVGDLITFISLAKEFGVINTLVATFPKLSSAIAAIGTALGTISAPVWVTIAAVIVSVGSAIYFLVENWQMFKEAASGIFLEVLGPMFEELRGHLSAIGQAFDSMYQALSPIIKPIEDFISFHAPIVIDFLLKIVEVLGAFVSGSLVGTVINVVGIIVGVFTNYIQVVRGSIEILSGFVSFWEAVFTGGDMVAPLKQMWDGVVNYVMGIVGIVVDPVVAIVKNYIEWFKFLYDVLVGHSIVPDLVNAIVSWFTGLPAKVMGTIDSFVTGIIDKFKNLWKSLTAWWDSKPKLKDYTPSIGDIAGKLKSAWDKAKSWWDKSKSALKSYTPSIGSIYEKLKDRWDNARTWWNEKKSAMKTYTPSIGSIYEKAKERWDNARDWWNSKKSAMKSYTPSIGSITDKIKSAWNSAKSWWNKNVGGLTTKLNVQVPKISVKWDTAEAFGKSFKYPTGFSLKFAANGGIFDQGSLIWAGERGPEIMATAAGGKTGVMNVQQMQDAVYEGVYAAVSAAMRGNSGGGSQAINIYLDGRQITSTVEQHQRERGATIMGNEVYSY